MIQHLLRAILKNNVRTLFENEFLSKILKNYILSVLIQKTFGKSAEKQQQKKWKDANGIFIIFSKCSISLIRNRLGQIISVPLNLYKQQTSPFLNSINLRPARDARLPRLTSNDYLLSARTIQLVSTLQDADADKHN